jgi:hypothetical protein
MVWVVCLVYVLLSAFLATAMAVAHNSRDPGGPFMKWTPIDLLLRFWPALVLLAGAVLLFMLRRLAVFAFAVVAALRVYEFVRDIVDADPEALSRGLYWFLALFTLLVPFLGLLYSLRLISKGVLRW